MIKKNPATFYEQYSWAARGNQSVARYQIGFNEIAKESEPKNTAAALCLHFCDGIYITQHDIILAKTQI